MKNILMLIQIAVIGIVLRWAISQLIKTTKEILDLTEVKISFPVFQKTKNLASSLATQRDPKNHFEVTHQGAKAS